MYIKVRVITDCKKDELKKISEDTLEIQVRAPAERGLANARVIELIQKNLKYKRVRIVSGHTSPSKILSVE
jgi:uncharacterized protein (TIGR00251 family)